MNPIIEKVNIDCSIEELFSRFADLPNTSFLNSSLQTDAGRYSFIGLEPFLVLNGKNTNLDPFISLKNIISTYKIKNCTDMPFVGGGIGYLSYDLKDVLEKLPQKAKDDLKLPNIYFVFYRVLLIHDRLKPKELYISVLDGKLIKKIKKIIKFRSLDSVRLRRDLARDDNTFVIPSEVPEGHKVEESNNIKSNFTKSSYIKSVKKVINYIRAGDIYQACLSQRFKTEWSDAPYELYLKLNKINPAPFSAYLNFEPAKIISSSPELFLRLRNNIVETRPMKGTRPRGKTKKEDAKFKEDLKKSDKDAAELSMIVDLERNDLGRICIPGSVKVAEHRRIETYPTVFQTISIIRGKVKEKTNPVDIIKAAFPGGSITGCPKIRAMEIIDELEPTRRSVYTGAIGFISFHDTMDLNVAIRTMIMKGKDVYFQAGGGITADSDPLSEYLETLDKARAMIKSLA